MLAKAKLAVALYRSLYGKDSKYRFGWQTIGYGWPYQSLAIERDLFTTKSESGRLRWLLDLSSYCWNL